MAKKSQIERWKRKPKITIRWKTEGGDALWQHFRFSQKSGKYIAWQMSAMGVWSDKGDVKTDSELARLMLTRLAKLEGKFATIKVSHREYNGKTYTDGIVDFMEQGEPAPKVSSSEEIPF